MTACGATPEPGHGEGEETVSPTRAIPLVDARRNAIQLELRIQNLLTREYGVGVWQPIDKRPQVRTSSTVKCLDDQVTETWRFATAGPIKDSQWKEAVERVYKILKPLGYDKPGVRQIRNSRSNDHVAVFNHPGIGGRVEIGYDKATLVSVNTGCAKGETWEGWPDGTEVLPEHLRTTGRAPSTSNTKCGRQGRPATIPQRHCHPQAAAKQHRSANTPRHRAISRHPTTITRKRARQPAILPQSIIA